jgi:uncharacterized protein YqgC (DUF456 family)
MDATILLWLLAAVLVVAGILGLVLPVLPGTPLLFAGLLIAAWVEDFAYVGAGTLTGIAVLAILTYPIDFAATARCQAVRRLEARRRRGRGRRAGRPLLRHSRHPLGPSSAR